MAEIAAEKAAILKPGVAGVIAHQPAEVDTVIEAEAARLGVTLYRAEADWLVRADAEGLVFDTLQITILIAVIISVGATLQAVEMLGEHLIDQGAIIDPVFGRRLLSVIVFVILAILFYLLHLVVRAFRVGWRPRRPPRTASPRPGA